MNENTELTLRLPIYDWNRIRTAMGKMPYENISDLFKEMDRQFNPQLHSLPESNIENKEINTKK